MEVIITIVFGIIMFFAFMEQVTKKKTPKELANELEEGN